MKKWHIYTNVFLIAAIAYLVYDLTGVDKLEKRMQTDYKALKFVLKMLTEDNQHKAQRIVRQIQDKSTQFPTDTLSIFRQKNGIFPFQINNYTLDNGKRKIALHSSLFAESDVYEGLLKLSPYFDTSKVWVNFINSGLNNLIFENYWLRTIKCNSIEDHTYSFKTEISAKANKVSLRIAPVMHYINNREEVFINKRKVSSTTDGFYTFYLDKLGEQKLEIRQVVNNNWGRKEQSKLKLKIEVK